MKKDFNLKNIIFTQEIIIFGLGYMISLIATLLGVKYLTKVMSPYTYGEFSLYLTIASFASLIFYRPIGQGAGRYIIISREKKEIVAYSKVLLFF